VLILGTVKLFSAFSDGDIFGLLLWTGVLAVAGGLLSPLIAGVLGGKATDLLYAGQRLSRPQPAYSIPRARRVAGAYEEALEELRKIVQAHPSELEAWTEMIDIVLVDLRDGDRAHAIFQAMMSRHRRRLADEAREPQPRIKLPPDLPST
jgi:hypothetical protein